MSFWNVVKSVANSAKCMAGWHSGQYSHIEGKPKCNLGKRCPDCNAYVTKEKHEFSEWKFPNYTDCNAKRECIHCGHDEFKVIHDHERVGKDNSNCEIILRCKRCHDEKRGKAEHEWISLFKTELKVETEDGKKRKCKNCGTFG